MNKNYSLIFSIFFPCTILFSQQAPPPDLLLLNRESLVSAKNAFQKNDISPAAQKILDVAAKEMDADIVSVMQKKQTPPSGDKHDYMSLGPYWWPDTTKPDGLPYVRRDGERNPEYKSFGDNDRCDQMVNNVTTLALAFFISGKEEYAARAVKQVDVWFIDPATRMNPNLQFAQAIKGINEGRGIGIIETYSFRDLIDAFIILKQSSHWNAALDKTLNSWLTEFLRWLQSQNGKDEAGWTNNHGSAYDVQVSCIALYLRKEEIAKKILTQVGTKRIAVQIEPDGSQPLELERTKSWGYSNMNLEALIKLAILGERLNIDLWNFCTADGRSIRKAIDFLLPYSLGTKVWEWKQIVPRDPERLYFTLIIASEKYRESPYHFAAKKVWKENLKTARDNFLIK